MSGLGDGSSESTGGGPSLTFSGQWRPVAGVVGGAVEFTGAPSSGVARGTEGANPGTQDFAMSITFTSRPIPAGVGYSGNLMQKGRYDSPGQVKLQLVPTKGGTVNCRVKGVNGARMLSSSVNVDDGRWHTAICWREGSQIGLTVDGISHMTTFNAGAISSRELVRVGNASDAAGPSDQHSGKNDCAMYLIGWNSRADAARRTPC